MNGGKKIQLLNPAIYVERGPKPILFIDTYMWPGLLMRESDLRRLLHECCNAKAIIVAVTNVVAGELTQRELRIDVTRLCGHMLLEIPVGRITANQLVQALVRYAHAQSQITLSWDLAISEVPTLKPLETGIFEAVSNLCGELNRVRAEGRGSKERLVPNLIGVERLFWTGNLKVYSEFLFSNEHQNTAGRTYDQFFFTDYFTDLPAIMLRSYLFGYLLNERNIKPQDVIDIYTLSELLPYTALYIMDQDQHNRIQALQRHYPMLFDRLDHMCCISSALKTGELSPLDALRQFLVSIKNGH